MSRDVYADAARKYAHTLPGHILLAAEPAAIPASTLTLDVLVEQTEELEAAQKYALRAMLNGLDSIEDLQLFLGLDDRDILRAIAGLLDAEYIDYRPPPEGALRRLTLTDAGRDAARDAQLRRPAPATVPVVYDRLTRTVTPWNKRALTRTHVAKSNAARILLPPASAMPVSLHDLNVDALTAALDIRREPIHILGISGVTENPVYYYGAILLIYKNFDTNELRLGVDVDGTWSEPHAAVLEKIGAVDRLRITAAPADEVHESVTDSADRLGRDEVIALQTALDSNETGPDGNQLDRAQIRWLGVYEHPTWLNDAVSSSQHRLLIISPRITGSVVDQRWVDRVEKLAQTADVTIFWGHGDNTNTDETAVDKLHKAARRSTRLAIVRVPNTVAKVLVSDGYYIKTNFNWLSFRGTPLRRTFVTFGALPDPAAEHFAGSLAPCAARSGIKIALEIIGCSRRIAAEYHVNGLRRHPVVERLDYRIIPPGDRPIENLRQRGAVEHEPIDDIEVVGDSQRTKHHRQIPGVRTAPLPGHVVLAPGQR